jgi:circadian clock protein KaiB
MSEENVDDKPRRRAANRCGDILKLRLYIAGQTPKSLAAIVNLRRLCQEHSLGRNCVEIIDLITNPGMARGDQIVAIPTLVKLSPEPVRKVIGDLSNVHRVREGLDLPNP